jgi:hypothetical protein
MIAPRPPIQPQPESRRIAMKDLSRHANARVLSAAAVLLTLAAVPAPRTAAGPSLKAGPLSLCRSFLIAEETYGYRINGGDQDRTHYVYGEYGWARNTSDRTAWGATALIGFRGRYSGEVRAGGAVRIRRWISGGSKSLDVSIGPFLADTGSGSKLGGAGQIVYNVRDQIHLTSRWEYLSVPKSTGPQAPELDRLGWYLGAGLGSRGGLVASAVVGAVLAGVAVAMSD